MQHSGHQLKTSWHQLEPSWHQHIFNLPFYLVASHQFHQYNDYSQQCSYCLKQTEIVRLEQIQYRAAKLVTGALHYSSRDKLNIELGWETIQKRSDILGLSIFQKIHLHETRPLIRKCMPKLDFERQHFLRSREVISLSKTLVLSLKLLFSLPL